MKTKSRVKRGRQGEGEILMFFPSPLLPVL
jgi:hypothetical protein